MHRILKRIFFIILALVIAIISCAFLFWFLSSPEISYTTLHFDKNKDKLFLNDSLLWDTGATTTVIYDERKTCEKIWFGYVLFFDTFYKARFRKLYYSSQFNPIDSLSIRQLCFLIAKDIPKEMKYDYEIGLIGMNVISRANWIINFQSEQVDILSHNKIYKTKNVPQLIFKYEQKNRPETQLDFSVCKLENVLIDAGSDSELILLKSDIEIINKKYKPVDTLTATAYGMHSTSPIILNCYVYDSIVMNNVCFKNVEIVEGNVKRIIGFKFFKRFNAVFLNTKEKRFYFY
jgi:predicted aspartyl protease